MKIGIFGDSYASLNFNSSTLNQDWCWPKLLSGDYSVDNYAYSGTSIEFSYYNFVKHYEKYDLIFFFITNVNRTTVFGLDCEMSDLNESKNKFECFSPKLPYQHNLQRVVDGVPANMSHMIKQSGLFKSEIEYGDTHVYSGLDAMLANYPYHNYIPTHAMLIAINSLHDNIVNIKCFDEMNEYRTCMHNISRLDRVVYDKPFPDTVVWEDPNTRANHISKKQNEEFYINIKDHINGKIDINHTLRWDTVEDYYTTSPTMKDSGLYIKEYKK